MNVNVLIYLLWRVDQRQERIQDGALAEAEAAVSAWRDEIVVPLRALRRQLKIGPSPAPSNATEALRGRLKAAEIDAEHIELDLLEQLAGVSVNARHETSSVEARRALDLLVPSESGARPANVEAALEKLLNALSR